jgi:dethiobiotin synthetase
VVTEILFITGTDTGVGKTQVTAGIAAAIWSSRNPTQRSRRQSSQQDLTRLAIPHIWKPVQTGTALGSPDADSYRLKLGSGTTQAEEDIVSHTFPDPLAPWMAAERAGQPIDYRALIKEGLLRKAAADIFLVEGAGGLAVPITTDKLMMHLAVDLALRVLIVSRPTLGTVNHTLLSIEYAKQQGLEIAGVILNGYRDAGDASLQENARMIEHFSGISVIGKLPWFPCTSTTELEWELWREQWGQIVADSVDISKLLVTI